MSEISLADHDEAREIAGVRSGLFSKADFVFNPAFLIEAAAHGLVAVLLAIPKEYGHDVVAGPGFIDVDRHLNPFPGGELLCGS